MVLAADKRLHISGGVEHGQETCQGNVGEKELVTVHRVHAEKSFTHVDESLGNSYNEELVGCSGARVVLGKISQVTGELGVVGACSNETQGEDRAHGDFLITIISEFVEEIHRLNLRVRDTQKSHCQRNTFSDRWFSVLKKMIHGPQAHLRADFFTKGDEGDS